MLCNLLRSTNSTFLLQREHFSNCKHTNNKAMLKLILPQSSYK